jgi:integrase
VITGDPASNPADVSPATRPAGGPPALGPPPADVEAAAALMGASMAASTVHAYARDWRAWAAYADAHGLDPLPADPAHVCAFLAAYATGRKATTTQRAAMAIGKAHHLAGLASPVDHEHVRRTLAGLRRTKGMALRQALPLCTDDVARLVAAAPGGLRGVRDRAFVLAGFVGAFRVGELVALDAEDLDPRTEGIVVRVQRAKTDQEGRGRIKPLPLAPERVDLCPVRALRSWRDAAGIETGPLWRGITKGGSLRSGRLTTRAALELIKVLAERAGMHPERISPHSLRAGHVTEAKRRDAPDLAVMNQTHHARAESLLGYVRESDPFRHTSAKFLGL